MTNGSSVISLTEYNQDEFHLLHAQTVENTMRYFARELGFADEEDFWGIVGLLHDLDFEKYPEEHCIKSQEIMKERGIDERSSMQRRVTDMLGWTLEDLIQRTIDALKTFQD